MRGDWQAYGKKAESAAEHLLRGKGYRILDRNIRFANGEIDLVAEVDEMVVFVEVKARRTTGFGGAVYAISPRKKQRLVKLASQYLTLRNLSQRPCRFDVVLYQEDSVAQGKLEHIEHAFEVPGNDLRWWV